ncbi:MAG: exopolysaccharide Pel transporter PelG, partial [Calditerrivibrio sp.]|nr:exopolysaccharide Pel transporter PelG [Calditerrivibrio sp.]
MAGIGFELRKILKEDSLLSLFKVYGYAAVLSSGPWIISILSIIFVGIVNIKLTNNNEPAIQFQVIVTYLVAFSLIFTGFFQLSFTRYVADRIFEKDFYRVLPNYFGLIAVTIFITLIFSIPGAVIIFPDSSNLLRVVAVSSFVILCCLWNTNSLLLGLKEYKRITLYFFVGYLLVVVLAILFRKMGVEGYLVAFLIGNSFIFFSMFSLVVKNYKSDRLVEFDFLLNKKRNLY